MTKNYARQRLYHERLLDAGRVRMPGGFLTPEAAEALDQLTQSGMSKSEAINAALIAYNQQNCKAITQNT